MPKTAPYGTWRSPITPGLITAKQVGLASPWLDGGNAYWAESRPLEGGRVTLLRRAADGPAEEVTPAPFNVRTRVHEYGGGAYTARGGLVVSGDFARPAPLPAAAGGAAWRSRPRAAAALRYADLRLAHGARARARGARGPRRGGSRERDRRPAARRRPPRAPCSPAAATSTPSPASAPTAARLAWTCWDHPTCPGTAPSCGSRRSTPGAADRRGLVAGGPSESRSSSPSGTRRARSTSSPTATAGGTSTAARRRGSSSLTTRGRARPPAVALRRPTYAFLDDGSIVCARAARRGIDRLTRSTRASGADHAARPSLRRFRRRRAATAARVVQAAGRRRTRPRGRARPRQPADGRASRSAGEPVAAAGYLAIPRAIEFPTDAGGGATRFYYPPANPDFAAPAGELPPLIVMSHGGPTSHATPALDLQFQYWTSRGFARRRRQLRRQHRLRPRLPRAPAGSWGIVDIEDCIAAARHLADAAARPTPTRLVDPRRQRRRLHDALRAGLPRRVRRRRQLLRRRRPRGAGHATRTSSSRATSTA